MSTPALGAVLMELGFVDPQQLQSAISIQEETGRSLPKVLVESGMLSEERLVHALSRQLRIDVCDPLMANIHERVLQKIPTETAFQHGVLPFALKRQHDQDILFVATHDPLNEHLRLHLESISGHYVQWLISAKSSLELALVRHYGDLQMRADTPAPGSGDIPVIQGTPESAPRSSSSADLEAYNDTSSGPEVVPDSLVAEIHVEDADTGDLRRHVELVEEVEATDTDDTVNQEPDDDMPGILPPVEAAPVPLLPEVPISAPELEDPSEMAAASASWGDMLEDIRGLGDPVEIAALDPLVHAAESEPTTAKSPKDVESVLNADVQESADLEIPQELREAVAVASSPPDEAAAPPQVEAAPKMIDAGMIVDAGMPEPSVPMARALASEESQSTPALAPPEPDEDTDAYIAPPARAVAGTADTAPTDDTVPAEARVSPPVDDAERATIPASLRAAPALDAHPGDEEIIEDLEELSSYEAAAESAEQLPIADEAMASGPAADVEAEATPVEALRKTIQNFAENGALGMDPVRFMRVMAAVLDRHGLLSDSVLADVLAKVEDPGRGS